MFARCAFELACLNIVSHSLLALNHVAKPIATLQRKGLYHSVAINALIPGHGR
jgi:hypothetical protein